MLALLTAEGIDFISARWRRSAPNRSRAIRAGRRLDAACAEGAGPDGINYTPSARSKRTWRPLDRARHQRPCSWPGFGGCSRMLVACGVQEGSRTRAATGHLSTSCT